LAKEWREFLSSRAWWVMLVLTGPLVGVSFISSVRVYAEASGLGGTSGGVGQAFSPLVGVWAPMFSAYEIAAVFLLPFVVIRLVAGDWQSGVLKLELQQSLTPLARIATKSSVLLAGWLVTAVAGAAGILLWISYGGHSYAPEIFAVVLGHLLNAGLTIAFAAAAASITEHPSTAAIVTFAFTVGTWVVHFVAAVHGGIWERISSYTPAAMVANFQRGLVQLNTVLIALTIIVCGLGIGAVWMRLGLVLRKRVMTSVLIGAAGAVAIFACTFVRANWDLSESRQNSFSREDEAALRQITMPLRIEAHLAPQDGRRADLERQTLSKLRRIMPDMQINYISATSIGLFEQTAEHYGEVWYEMGGRRILNRLTTPEAVLDTIFEVANVKPPDERDDSVFPGYPLAAPPAGAALVFYGIWPVLTGAAAFFVLRRNR